MLDKLESFGRKNAGPEYSSAFVKAIAEARKKLEDRLNQSAAP